jgi:hypothetical protein
MTEICVSTGGDLNIYLDVMLIFDLKIVLGVMLIIVLNMALHTFNG